MDHLTKLPIDIFIKSITYLPFSDVINICSLNKKSYNYCNDIKYNNHWKKLIDDTFSDIDSYELKLKEIWTKLGLDNGTYNYIIYTKLVELLDPITQLIIYYRQKDIKNFNSFNQEQRFLALFLLNDSKNMRKYVPNNNYNQSYLNFLKGNKISKDDLNKMLIEMAKNGSVKGIKLFLARGADINGENYALIMASSRGYIDVVKYLVENGANIHTANEEPLILAGKYGHLPVVKYLIEHGAFIHTNNDEALRLASRGGYLSVVKYLVEHGADIHVDNDIVLRKAIQLGYVDLVNYLKSLP